jgi:hypothetical protein
MEKPAAQEQRNKHCQTYQSSLMSGQIPIVLTATVIPNGITAAINDPESRLREYLAALAFYREFAPVFFLENSAYPLEKHPEFRQTERFQVRRFQPSANPERGKGYQEFEMLDAWMSSEAQPPERWLKISGRYQILNISNILAECRRAAGVPLIVDQARRSSMARTYYFCAGTEYYRNEMKGLYRQCDDRTGEWIERILFRKLKTARDVRYFVTQPRIQATAGGSGGSFPTGKGQWLFKQILRHLNRLVDNRYLWHAK